MRFTTPTRKYNRFSKSASLQAAVAAFLMACGLLLAAEFELGGQVTPQAVADVSGVERYLTHINTDKPIYRPGERVYVRGVVLRADGHTPMVNAYGLLRTTFQIKGPKGETVTSGVSERIDSVVGFSWAIPEDQAGGEYTIRISHPAGDAPTERKFDIRTYRAPRLKSQIAFVRDGYGPGDTVTATLHVERAEGGIPNKAKVAVTARVDGKETWNGSTTVDASGNAGVTFKLPAGIERGEGVLAMVIEDGGTVETATKSIPILLQTLDLATYPEGGDLIAGLPNRVYLEARTPTKKPADIAGVIVDGDGKEVARFRTEHEGRGRLAFVPASGEPYSIRVTEPSGIKTIFPLPKVKASGVVLSSVSDIVARQQDMVVRVAATSEGEYGIGLSQRGREFSFKPLALRARQPADITLVIPKFLDGVVVVTVYDHKRTPMAERLLFRQPEHNLKVQITTDRTDYVPGDKVNLRVTTTDDAGKPVSAVVGLTVTDSSVLEMIEKREQAPRLPAMVLLESDVKDFGDAHVYLDERNPKAALATDLLLGTQGWRRFATGDMAKFIAAHGDAARRVLGITLLDVELARAAAARGPAIGAGIVHGVVVDATGAFIPGVRINATNTATGIGFAAITNERGIYALHNVDPGAYRVSATLPGFRTATVPNLRVAADRYARQDFPLDVATVNQMVEVAAMVFQAVDAEMANVGRRNLPLVGREPPRAPRDIPRIDVNERLEKAIVFGRIDADRKLDQLREQELPELDNFVVREYAHTRRSGWTEGSRVDFAETVYWNAGIKTDAWGHASVSFDLSDSVTSFRVLGDAFGGDGTLGSTVSHVESVQPFSVEPKIPLQVTSGDVIQLPIGIVNGTSRELSDVAIAVQAPAGIKFTMLGNDPSTLRPKERARRLVRLEVGRNFSGPANLTITAKAGQYSDTVSRTLDVQSLGFPREVSTGGVLESNRPASFEFTLPDSVVDGSLASNVTVYPTPLASMTDALRSLLNQPYGCFEQTSSTSYPMVMAQQYFLTHTGVDAELIEKAKGLLDVSYKRLVGFETPTKGYEWFGADPGHEALTAYGLLQFTDMSQVRNVDKAMIDRTRAWLLARRDGKGGFRLNSRALDSFGGAPADTTAAYIVWALVESGERQLAPEIARIKSLAFTSQDSYIVALAVNILHATGDSDGASQLMNKLARSQETAGSVKGAVTSITRSGGESLTVETTALATLAWMRDPSYAANAQKGMKWILETNKNGRFGSTQSTILALRSIIAYDAANARPRKPGRIVLSVDGKTVGTLSFDAAAQGALVMPEFPRRLAGGKHTVALKMEEGSKMPYAITVKYHSVLPANSEQAQVGVQVGLKDRDIQEGSVTEASVTITNKSDAVIPTPLAIVGIPGGLEVRHDQLKELVKSGKIDAYEVRGREIILYWRYLKAQDNFDLPLSLVAAVPGAYSGPASRAYLYYTDEYKNWAPGLSVNITPR